MLKLGCRCCLRPDSTQFVCWWKYSICGLPRVAGPGMAGWRLEIGGEGSFGEREHISSGGELLRELGGVRRVPPRRT
jgi:hypothetical protein